MIKISKALLCSAQYLCSKQQTLPSRYFEAFRIQVFHVFSPLAFHLLQPYFDLINLRTFLFAAMALRSHYLDSATAHSNLAESEPLNSPHRQLAPYQFTLAFDPNESATNPPSSNDFTISSTVPIVKQNRRATKESWEMHRPLIAQLYQKKPLTEVMRFMEREHAFKAT